MQHIRLFVSRISSHLNGSFLSGGTTISLYKSTFPESRSSELCTYQCKPRGAGGSAGKGWGFDKL